MDKVKCPKCNSEMEEGKINTPASPTWTPIGKVALMSGKKFSTYACPKCGYMESYLNK